MRATCAISAWHSGLPAIRLLPNAPAEILSAYAVKYSRYKRHNTAGEDKVGGGRIMAQTLDESVWLIPVAWGYSLVRETLAAKERAHIESDLLVAAAEVIREHRMGIHNIQCWKNSAVGLRGLRGRRARIWWRTRSIIPTADSARRSPRA